MRSTGSWLSDLGVELALATADLGLPVVAGLSDLADLGDPLHDRGNASNCVL